MMTRILLVEDDVQMGALVAAGLRDEGYDVTLVENGIDALVAAATVEFGAAAVDVMLPEMSGFEICRHLRARGSTLPVLLLTARDSVDDRVHGLDSGADDYLIKPFAFAELSARIRALVRRDSATPKPTLRIGRLELDSATVRASFNGSTLPLSIKEFALLRFFATHLGAVVTREEILDDVWGTRHHIDRTVVDQYVSYLRRKLDPIDSGVRIATVRGSGYVFEVKP
ncbi:response regulator transcription factor [Microbacterium sp. 1P10UB]|uniref:response regulator transcription factor n=1 Tax=unclassified Microbacterium TaxID=2609290 RepID=UPI0039A24262